MKVLLTGANGYIGGRLLLRLLEAGHFVYPFVRSSIRLDVPDRYKNQVKIIVGDLLDPKSLEAIPDNIEAAYYLVHSMGMSATKFAELEATSARNFVNRLDQTNAKQIIYLSGLSNETTLSPHFQSRRNVETILRSGKVPVTTLMAAIIIGAGSASFEIIRDLVEKLPLMIAPKWTRNQVQPISILDVMDYLILVLDNPKCTGGRFEIGGPDIYSYKELLLRFAKIRGLKRFIINVPFLTPKLSSYWLYLITSVNFSLARSLVESLKNNAICTDHKIEHLFPKKLLTFDAAVSRAFERLEQDNVPSSWRDALGDSHLNPNFSIYLEVPHFGVYTDRRVVPITGSASQVQEKIWRIGGRNGWYYMDWAWSIRGFIDRLIGGVGPRRGRTHEKELSAGEALDFWRVLVADKPTSRLLLYAEMKVPGEAWLELKIVNQTLYQTATFRPRGLFGRLYWYALLPFHLLIFRGLAQAIARG